MARDFNGTTDRIDYANILDAGATPCTVSVWLYRDIGDRDEYVLNFNQNGDASRGGPVFFFNSDLAGRVAIYLYTDDVAGFRNANETTTGSWVHWIFTWDGGLTAANWHIYKNNSEVSYAGTTNAVGNILDGQGKWSLGGRTQDDNRNFDGKIAELGYWNRVLSAGERKGLAAGYSPRFYPNGLKFAPDLIRDQRDPISGKTGTLDGTTVSSHPRVIRLSKIWTPHIVAAAPPSGGQFIMINMSKLIIPVIYFKQGKTKRRDFMKNTLLASLGIK